ncbi:MAG: hypothetical protein O7E52_05585 [Candidatus Poribacteria bacterium]|nr:hypothetical protein [Candidatus Poribacteria bacterium]
MVRIFYLVFSQLAVGGLGLLLLIPKDLVGRGFYRLMGAIYLLIIICARCANLAINHHTVGLKNFLFVWQEQDSALVLIFFLLTLFYMISLWLKPAIINRLLLILSAVVGLIWIVYSANFYLDGMNLPGVQFLLPAQFLISTVLLGAVNSGMWFGHWYLVTPRLPVIYLKRFNQIFLISLILSISFFALNVIFRWQAAPATPLNFFHQLIFGLRAFLGFGGSVVMYIIIWYCLRDQATQQDVVGATRAATGFLYIAMLTVFIGELCGRLLLLEVRFIL